MRDRERERERKSRWGKRDNRRKRGVEGRSATERKGRGGQREER